MIWFFERESANLRCEIRREMTGEGLIGLSRAFFYAGSRAVLATLWNLNDRFAAEFVRFVHRRMDLDREIIAGVEPIEATKRGIDRIVNAGAFPTVCIFRPTIGSEMEDVPPPDPESMREVFVELQRSRRHSVAERGDHIVQKRIPGGAVDHHRKLVGEAPDPVLARLKRADQLVTARGPVGARVALGR